MNQYIIGLKNYIFSRSTTVRMKCYEDFAMALEDGVNPKARVNYLVKSAKRSKSWKADVYSNWEQRLLRMGLIDAIRPSLPVSEYVVLQTSTYDSKLPEAMRYLNEILEIKAKIASIYMSSYLSPMAALLAIVSALYTNALLIVPINMESMPIEKWPSLTKALYYVSTAFVDHTILIIIGVILAIYGLNKSCDYIKGPVRTILEKLPLLPYKGHKQREADNFLMSLTLMLQSGGRGISECLKIMRDISTPWMAWHIERMERRLQLVGDKPAMALDTGLFTTEEIDRIVDLSERTSFYASLKKIAIQGAKSRIAIAEKKAMRGAFLAIVFSALVIMIFAMANMDFNMALQSHIRSY